MINFMFAQRVWVLLAIGISLASMGFAQSAQTGGLKFRALDLRNTPDPPGPQIAFGGSTANRVCDVNGDGLDDIVLGASNHPGISENRPASVRVLLNKGDGTFYENDAAIASSLLPMLTQPRIMECADFNGDGRADLYVAGHGWDAPPYPGDVNGLVLSSAGKWVDRSSTLPQTPDFSHSMAVGDIDADGDLDIYVGNLPAQNGVPPYLLINDGKGNFTKDTSRLHSMITNFVTISLASAFVDVDGDGFPELILGTYGQFGSKVFKNDGAGRFLQLAARQLLPPPPSPRNGTEIFAMSILALDVVRSGRQALLIAFTNPGRAGTLPTDAGTGNTGTVIQLLVNDGAGGYVDQTQERFQGSQTHPFPDWMEFLRPVDINGDGAIDLIAQSTRGTNVPSNINTPFLWLNDGNGHFSAITMPMLGLMPTPGEMFAIDVNGDGLADLVNAGVDQTTGWPRYQVFLNETTPPPRTAIWWRPGEPGRGFAFEYGAASGSMLGLGFVFDAAGRSDWFASPCALLGSVCSAPMVQLDGGSSLSVRRASAVSGGVLGALSFESMGRESAKMTWPGGMHNLEPWPVPGLSHGLPASPAWPERGIYASAQDPGTAVFLDLQRDHRGGVSVFLVYYLYTDGGKPAWYFAMGPLGPDFRLQTELYEVSGGSGIHEPAFRVPNQLIPRGPVLLRFTSSAGFQLDTGGRVVQMTRFSF